MTFLGLFYSENHTKFLIIVTVLKIIMIKNLRHIAFPEEHGSWGFVLEPLILSLIVAYSADGLFLALASFLFFLAHQPIKIIVNPKKSRKMKIKAIVVLTVYVAAALYFLTSIFVNNPVNVFFPFILALLFMLVYLFFEILGLSRKLATELIASSSIDFIAVSVLLLGGMNSLRAWAILALLLNRAIPTVLFVHERINFVHKRNLNRIIPISSGLIGFFVALVFAYLNWIPWLGLLGILILVARMIYGLTPSMLNQSLKTAGILEFVYGILFVVITAFSYYLW